MARTVLVADDSPVIQNKAKGILAGEGFEVITVSNGVAAIKKLPLVNPLVILADVSMPGKDGYEVCDYVKNSPQLCHVPVLLVVSDMEDYNKERAAQVRADGFINKRSTKTPFDPAELISAVLKLVAQSEASVARAGSPTAVNRAPEPATTFEPESEEPLVPAARNTVDIGALSGEVAFTEPAPEATPPIRPDLSPLAPEPTKSFEIPSAPPPSEFRTVPKEPYAKPWAEQAPTPLTAAEPVLIDELPAAATEPTVPASKPSGPERTLMFRSPADIVEAVLRDDLTPAPPAPESPRVSPPPQETPGVPATSLGNFSLTEALTGQVRFYPPESEVASPIETTQAFRLPSTEVSPPADVNLVSKIVNKVVTKTSPAAIPLQAIEEMVKNLVEEIVAELNAEHPSGR